MTGSNSFWFAKSDTGFFNDVIGQSLKFEQGDSPDLSLSGLSGGSNTTGTISFWCKRGDLSDDMRMWSNYAGSGTDRNQIGFLAGDTLSVQIGDTAMRTTTRVFRDTTSWYHIVVAFDSTQGTANDRIKVYVNGVQETSFGTTNNPSEDAEIFINNDKIYWGRRETSNLYFDGYLAECIQIDGSQLTPTSFGEFSNGAWIPIDTSGLTYGTNGYKLNYKKEAASATGYSHYFSGSATTFSHASHYDIGSSDDYTLEFFHKSAMSDAPNVLGYYQTAGPHFNLQLSGTSNVYFYTGNGAAHTFTAGGDASYTANAWNHTAIVRSSGTTKCYINGYQTTAGTTSYSDTTAWDTDRFGIASGFPGQPAFTGYISNVRLVVGSAVYTSNFTPSTTPLTNITNTKLLACQTTTLTKDNSSNDVTGSVSGTVIAYTDSPFTGGSPFYHDKSGRGNHFTHTSLIPDDVVIDSPENNFATFAGPINNTGQTLAFKEGNLECESSSFWSSSVWCRMSMAVVGGLTGKYYAEFVNHGSSGGGATVVGVGSYEALASSTTAHDDAIIYYYNTVEINGSSTTLGGNYSSTPGISGNEVVRMAWDVSNGKVWIGASQEWFDVGSGVGDPANASNPTGTISNYAGRPIGVLFNRSTNTGRCIMNFGQNGTFNGTLTAGGYADENGDGNFFYSVPSGFVCLSSKNLPEPAVGPNSTTQPTSHFQVHTFTGDANATRTISGLNFQPDLLWSKARNQSFSNQLYDSSRGNDKGLQSNNANAENTYDLFNGFTSDGYNTTTDGSAGDLLNYNGGTYVNWLWKANAGSTTTNDASATSVGTIDSVYQANTTAGFSIVTYTGTGSAGSIAHGLGAVPKFITIKNRTDGSSNWRVYHGQTGASDPETDYLYLNLTNTLADGVYMNDTAPTSSVFSIGTHNDVGSSGDDYIAYLWAEVDGMSKFGKFKSNGNANGEYIYLGFKPALFVAKSTAGARAWITLDNARPGYNPTGNYLYWNYSNAEGGAGSEYVDLLSNGVKIRTTGATIASAENYVYMAWAEMPQKYSLAR